jgi:hypothetical protein
MRRTISAGFLAGRIVCLTISFVLLSNIFCGPARAQEKTEPFGTGIWTAIIPDAFPRYIYTWRFKSDGTYQEDGRDALKGTPIQPTLSGSWTIDGSRASLRQNGQAFVFEGVIINDRYVGKLYLNGRPYSNFCAVRGDMVPKSCAPEGVASFKLQRPIRV